MVPHFLITRELVIILFVYSASSLNIPQDPKPGCRSIADVIFLLDGSDSISDNEFNKQREFIKRFLQLSDIGPDSIRVGLAVVSSTIGDEFPLSLNSTKENLLRVIPSITQPQEGSRTDLGLIEMEMLFRRHARRGVLRIGVILTDGRAKYVRATEGEARIVKDAGVFLIVVGVGRLIKFGELEKLASTKNNAYNLEPFDLSTKYLSETVTFLGQESCTGHLLVNELGLKPMQPIQPDTSSLNVTTDVPMSNQTPALSTKAIQHIAELSGDISNSNMSPAVPNKALVFSTKAIQHVAELFGNLNPTAVNLLKPTSGPSLVNSQTQTKDLWSAINALDVKSQPFIALEALKSRIAATQPTMANDQVQATGISAPINIMPLSTIGAFNTRMSEVLIKGGSVDKGEQPITKFTALQKEYPHPPASSTGHLFLSPQTATQTPITIVASTTPQVPPPTTSVPKTQNKVITYNEPTPTETANMIIKSLIPDVQYNNGLVPDTIPTHVIMNTVNPDISIDAIQHMGVGIGFPGHTVAETLAFIKKEIKPARTVEEHLNPIYQMFDVFSRGDSSRKKSTLTTTTVSPKDVHLRAEMTTLKDHCSNGRFLDGVAYASKPGTCTEFLQCYHEAGVLLVRTVSCPFETFFDDQHTVCQYQEQQQCWTDRCADPTVTSYGHEGNCRAYWACERGQSVPVCCPSGTVYITDFGCARNVTCSDTCMDFGNLKAVTRASQCKLLPTDADPQYYFEHVAGMGWVMRKCAPGSKFNQVHCKCSGTEEAVNDVCVPEFYMNFQSGLVDMSGNNLAMGVYNVDLDGGTGSFIGKSHLKLWRFSGMSLGQHVTISFRFRTSVTAPKGRLMHIVSNCCYSCKTEPKPSLDIAIIPGDQGGVAVFSTTTKEAGEQFLFVPFKDTFTGWNQLEYSYDGLNMRGAVNKLSAQKPIVGNIIATSEPLLIGACGMTNAYDGFLDETLFATYKRNAMK